MLLKSAVKVEHLTKRFGTVTAVDNISFEITHGSCVGLLGGNGALPIWALSLCATTAYEATPRCRLWQTL